MVGAQSAPHSLLSDICSGSFAVKIIRYLLYAFALAFSSTAGAASNYSSLIVFGDSLSDPGNAAALTALGPYAAFFPPSPFPYDFRFTNGPTAPEYLAGSYAAPVVRGWPDPVGATNFAVGGALRVAVTTTC